MVLSLKPHGHRFLRAVLLVLALAVSIATILAITRSVYAQTDVPDAPTDVAVYTYKSQQLEVRWSSSDAASTTSFKVQWKSGSEEFSSSRQISIDPATRKVDLQSTSIVERYVSRVSRLYNGTEYTVRVIATNANGDSDPSEEATGTPYPTPLQVMSFIEQVKPFIEREVIELLENSHPWLRETWDYITSQNVAVTFRPWAGGRVDVLCPSIAENNLWKCNAELVEIGRYEGRNPIYYVIVHELGHVYSLANGMASKPGPLGIAHLYLDDLVFPSYENLSAQELWRSGCDPSELYADALSIVTFGDWYADDTTYWSSCNLITDTVSDQALAVFRSAAAGEMPSWFADTYNDADGVPDLERLWVDVKAIRDGDDRRAAVFQLRNSFGGYCDNQKATDSVFGSGTTRNPWSYGGCVPDAPTNVSATPGSYLSLTVSWQEPVSDGGSPIEGYKVQWKSGAQEYSSSRQEVVADSIIRDNGKFSVLLKRIWSSSYNQSNTIRVLAYNQNGDGAANEITVTLNPATGAPTISGTAEVGETLTAGTSGISDADGLTNAVFTYQWLSRRDTEIAGATSSTYTLTDSDEGNTIKVRVSFTDDAGNQETLTSEATGTVAPRPNSAATGAPTISGTAQVGETLTADTSGISDIDGLDNLTYSYQWLTSRDTQIAGAISSTYTLAEADTGKVVKVRVSFTDDRGKQETLISAATGAVAARTNNAATGEPAISGTAQVGETLSASASGISDSDGLNNATFAYQWLSSDSDISGGTSATYTLVESDEGKTIKVRVSFTDDRGHQETLTSAATGAVAAAPPPLTASIHDEPSSHDGQKEFTFELRFSENLEGFSYKTLRDHAFTVTGGKVEGARRLDPPSNTKWQIKISPTSNGDVTIVLPITEDCTADGAVCTGDGRKLLSNRLEIIVSGPTSQQTSQQRQENTSATGSPTIGGTVQVGQTLAASTTGIADTDGLTNAAYSYQWIANDGSSDSNIADATANAYTLVVGDAGKTIKVKVTFTDDEGNQETLTSAVTAAVAATVPDAPGSLSVSVNDTGRLDVSWSVPDSNGGSAVTGYRVQWRETPDSWDTPADVSETTVTGTNHTVAGLTDGVEYTFRVFAVNSAGDSPASEDESGTPRETSAPTVSSGTVDGATLTLTFSEGLTETPLPAVATFTVNVGGNQRGVNTLAISGSTVTLTLASAVISTDDVSVGYTMPSDTAAARLRDLSDNPAESFTGQAVVNNTAAAPPPLTASIHDEPSSHDGQEEFTFELRFSENLEGFSYKTLRDNAFTVTGGKVEGARRLDPPSNTEWQIKIRPTSNGDVTIVLPITEDCTADGAVCTGDRKLSNRLEIIVSGPNG